MYHLRFLIFRRLASNGSQRIGPKIAFCRRMPLAPHHAQLWIGGQYGIDLLPELSVRDRSASPLAVGRRPTPTIRAPHAPPLVAAIHNIGRVRKYNDWLIWSIFCDPMERTQQRHKLRCTVVAISNGPAVVANLYAAIIRNKTPASAVSGRIIGAIDVNVPTFIDHRALLIGRSCTIIITSVCDKGKARSLGTRLQDDNPAEQSNHPKT